MALSETALTHEGLKICISVPVWSLDALLGQVIIISSSSSSIIIIVIIISSSSSIISSIIMLIMFTHVQVLSPMEQEPPIPTPEIW